MTDAKKNENSKAAVAELLGERKRPWYVRAVPAAVVLALAAGGGWYWWLGQQQGPKANYVTQTAKTGNLDVTVSADGTLNPIRTVTLGSELSGIVRKVNVDVNDEIKTDQVLIELDTRNLDSKVASARASLASAEAQVKDKRLKELNKLSGGKMPSRTDLDAQEAAVATAKAAVEVAKATIADAQAALETAETDRSKANIKSPIDGVVLARSVEPGYAVAASLQAVELLSLATDLRELELKVNVDEADIGSIQSGQKAYFTVSAYPDKRFPATLTKVAYGATTTENVVTYTTYLNVDNADLLLRPGMTASATVTTAERRNVLLVPNSALRFTPRTSAEQDFSGSAATMFMPRGPHNGSSKRVKEDISASQSVRERTVYILRNGDAVPVSIKTGLTDGTRTEVISGDLKDGDQVVVDQQRAKS